MPGKNKPKRLDRNRSWRVQRRKKKQRELVNPPKRSRAKRPKHKGKVAEVRPVKVVKKVVKKVTKKVVKAEKKE